MKGPLKLNFSLRPGIVIWYLLCGYFCINMGNASPSFSNEDSPSENPYNYDLAYVLNLDRAPKRYCTVKKVLDRHHLRHKRFSAIDGYKVRLIPLSGGKVISGSDLSDGTEKLIPNEKYRVLCTENQKQQKYPLYFTYDEKLYPNPTSAGELGCLCSHFLIWQDVADNNYNAVLVLEDDLVSLSENFQQFINQVIKDLPQESFVHLSLVHPSAYEKDDWLTLECKLGGDLKLCKVLSSTRALGTFAYIINSKMAKKLLKSADFHGPVDVTLLNKATSQEISIYAAFPFPLHIENDYNQSIIAHMSLESQRGAL